MSHSNTHVNRPGGVAGRAGGGKAGGQASSLVDKVEEKYLDDDEEMEEAMEAVEEDGGEVPTGAKQIAEVQKILLELEANPDDPELRALTKRYIKVCFIRDG